MKNKNVLGIFVFAAVALLGVSGLAAAHGWFGFGSPMANQDIQTIQEDRKAMQDAIDNKDYSVWKDLMEKQIAYMQSQITENNFNAIVDQHAKMEEFRSAIQDAKKTGDYSKVQTLQKEYGIMPYRMGHNLEASSN